MTTLKEGDTTCVCVANHYMNGNGTCVGCPDDVNCKKVGSTLLTQDLNPGTWRVSNKSDVNYECPVKESCVGGNSTDAYCKKGHKGMLCAVCEDGWYRGSNSTCTQCPADMRESINWTAGISVGIAAIFVVVVLLDLRFGWSKAKGGSRIKLMTNCVQQLTVLILFPAKWPDTVKDLGTVLKRFSPGLEIVSPACLGVPMDFYSRFGFSAALVFSGILLPQLVAVLVASIMTCCALSKGRQEGRRGQGGATGAHSDGGGVGGVGGVENQVVERAPTFRRTFRAMLKRTLTPATRYSLIVMLFSHPAMSGQTFFFFSCQQIGLNEDGSPAMFLVADYSLRCDDALWLRLLPFALFMVVFFVFGVPLLLLVLLMKNRAVIRQTGRDMDDAEAEAALFKELGDTIDIDKARALFRQVDTDHGGTIDFAEFAKWTVQHGGSIDVAVGGIVPGAVTEAAGLPTVVEGKENDGSPETKGSDTELEVTEVTNAGIRGLYQAQGNRWTTTKPAAADEDSAAMMLAVLWADFKPDFFYFDMYV